MVLAFISEENCVIFAFGTAQNMKLNDSSGIAFCCKTQCNLQQNARYLAAKREVFCCKTQDNLQQIASKKLKKWFKTCFLWSKYSF